MTTKNLDKSVVATQRLALPAQNLATSRSTFLHPASGALILSLDWLLFSGTIFTGGLAIWFTGITGLVIGGIGTGLIQRHFGRDARRAAALKGLAAGIVVGAPFPVAGTAVGGMVLVLSGLDRILKYRATTEG